MTQLAVDGDNNAFFPSPAGGKILTARDGSTVMAYATARGSALWRKQSGVWSRGALLPVQRPYIVVDHDGYVHVFGLRDTGGGQRIWHFRALHAHRIDAFDSGESVYEKNYSAATIDDDGTLYYFGAGLEMFGFRKKERYQSWSPTKGLMTGPCIYPGAISHKKTLHLIFCGWNTATALYEKVFYMRSVDRGETWTKSDGTPILIPADWTSESVETLTTGQNTGGGQANTHNLSLLVDRADRPHVLYWFSRPYFTAFGTASGSVGPEPNIRVQHVRRDADGWKRSLLCTDPKRDVGYAVLTEDPSGRLHAIVTHKHVDDPLYELGHTWSDDSGDTWSPITSLTNDARQRGLSYAHPAVNPVATDKLEFVANMWSGKNPSPIFYGEILL